VSKTGADLADGCQPLGFQRPRFRFRAAQSGFHAFAFGDVLQGEQHERSLGVLHGDAARVHQQQTMTQTGKLVLQLMILIVAVAAGHGLA
jgi:hypothetical protein